MKLSTITILFLPLLFSMGCGKKENLKAGENPLSVKTILASPKKFQNRSIRVIGNIYEQHRDRIQLIDLSECSPSSSCDPVKCKIITLPVKHGLIDVPPKGTDVIVYGKITTDAGRFSFFGSKIEVYHEN